MNLSHDGSAQRRFTRKGAPADPVTAALIREDLGHWLRRMVDLGETRLCDVILAVNEALANSVEFAYPDGAGTFDLEAAHYPVPEALTVSVLDHGRWRQTDALRNDRNRGRGLQLMRALADAVVIDTSALGTTVCLRFDGVHSLRAAQFVPG